MKRNIMIAEFIIEDENSEKPKWELSIEIAADDPVSIVKRHGKELLKFYDKFMEGRSAYSVTLKEKHRDNGSITQLFPDEIVKPGKDKRRKRKIYPNRGLTKAMTAFFKIVRYGQDIDLKDTYDYFHTNFPELSEPTFITYMRNKAMAGCKLLVDELAGTIRKIDDSPV